MADTTYQTGVVISSAWLNALNDFFYTLFAGSTTAAQARSALGLTDGTADLVLDDLTVNGNTILGDAVGGGNTTINLLTSGQLFTVVTAEGNTLVINQNGNVTLTIASGDTFLIAGAGTTRIQTDLVFDSSAVTFENGSTIALPSGTTINGITAGYLGIPQNSQSAGYTLVLTDNSKHIYMASAGAYTIPANGSVAFPIGTAISFYNASASSTIPITTDTLRWAADGSTGTRTLAQYGLATIVKVASTVWVITGTGLT